MNRALWLLTWLRFRAVLRRFTRNLHTVKGLLLGVTGILVCGSCLSSWLFSLVVMPAPEDSEVRLEMVRRYGALGILAMSILPLLSSAGNRTVVPFNPAEVNFLFAGPFSRRQLLGNRLLVGFISCAAIALLFTAGFSSLRIPTVSPLARFGGMALTLWFIQLFTIALAFIANTVGVRAFNRGRKFMLLLVAIVIVLVLYRAGREALSLGPNALLERVEQMPGLQVALEPLRWFVRAFTAERLWPDFALWGSLSLLLDSTLLLLVFALDVQYLESAAAASERIYAQVQRIRRGGAAMVQTSGKAHFSLPNFPWLGGIGPVAWRQLTSVPRSRVSLILLGTLAIFLAIAPLASRADQRTDFNLPLFLGIQVITMLTLFVTPLMTYDFRGDLDRIDVLKTLPVRPLPLVIGQLVVPVLLLSILHAITLAILAFTASRREVALGAVVGLPFILPFNFLLFAADNLMFLVFPGRGVGLAIGDLQTIGRQVLLSMGKFLILGLAGIAAALLAVPVYFLAGNSLEAALTIAWIVLMAFGVALLPVLALAFRHYDVARDTPP